MGRLHGKGPTVLPDRNSASMVVAAGLLGRKGMLMLSIALVWLQGTKVSWGEDEGNKSLDRLSLDNTALILVPGINQLRWYELDVQGTMS